MHNQENYSRLDMYQIQNSFDWIYWNQTVWTWNLSIKNAWNFYSHFFDEILLCSCLLVAAHIKLKVFARCYVSVFCSWWVTFFPTFHVFFVIIVAHMNTHILVWNCIWNKKFRWACEKLTWMTCLLTVSYHYEIYIQYQLYVTNHWRMA